MHTSSILPTPIGVEIAAAPPGGSARQSSFRGAGLAVWRALEASGHARAIRELRALHGHWEISDPEFARKVRDGNAFPEAQIDRRRG